MNVKTFLNTLDILSVVQNIKDTVIGSYINNVYSYSSGITLLLRKEDVKNEMLIDIRGWLVILRYEIERGSLTPFCRNLRKNIVGCKILEISVPFFDRLIRLSLSNGYNLYIEFMQGGNIILEKDGAIVDAYKEATYKDREIKKGKKYVLPEVYKFNPIEISINDIYSRIRGSNAGIISSLFKFFGIPSEIVEEACYIQNISKNEPVKNISDDDLLKTIETVLTLIKAYLNSKETYVYSFQNKVISISNIALTMYKQYECNKFSSINDALNYYYFKIIEYLKEQEEEKIRQEINKKIEIKLKQLYENLNNVERRKVILTDFTKLLNNYKDYFNSFFEKIMEFLYLKKFEELKKYVYSEWIKEIGEIREINLKEKKLIVDFKNEQIQFDMQSSFMKNMNEIYENIKKLKKASEELIEKIESLKAETLPKSEKKQIELKEKKAKKWYENYLWFITSNDHLCVAGKDASQNESLIKKRVEEKDIIFHADIHGSPFAILKTEDREVIEDEIMEVAQFVVSYSSAWKYGFSSMNAYWVKKDQVSKKAPSGMYLSKGSFMIYGKKNIINNVPLRLAVVIENSNVKIYPHLTAQKKFKEFVIIAPGSMEKDEAIKEITKRLIEKKSNLNLNDIKNYLLHTLPKGRFTLLNQFGI